MEHSDNVNKESSNNNETKQSEKKTYDFDKLQLYFAEPYAVQKKDNEGNVISEIIINQPTIGDIISVGEGSFYNTLYTFVLNTTSYRLQLWDMGVDWNKISDYELFCMLIKNINPEVTQLFFKGINFTEFELYNKKISEDSDEQVITLFNPEQGIEIDEETYTHIAQYLRTMFNIFPKVEKAKGKTTKQWLIEEEREKLRVQKNENGSKSMLLPLVSAYLNHPGTKYKKYELKEIGIYEFMDGIQRIQIYESTISLMGGMYSGMVDTKGIDKEAFNFMREN